MSRRDPLRSLLVFAFLLAFTGTVPAAEPKPAAVGDKVPNSSSLRDRHGNRRPLHDFKGHKAVVLVFVGADCPVSNVCLPDVIALEKKYRSQSVQFLAVYPNESEDLDQVAAHAYDRDLPFPVLKDFGQKLADAVGITRVPALVLLDGDFVLRYRGRLDDRNGAASRKDKATRADLTLAIDEVLAGKKVSVAETEADGCLIDRGAKKPAKTDVTYAKDVAPILQARCQSCHRPNQAAPFSLLTYDDAAKHGRMLKEVTTQRRMPPWHADARYGHFSNDRRLTVKEIDTLTAWVDGGMAKGDEKDLPKPIAWPEGWALGKPDMILEMPEAFEVPATGVVPYKNWVIETNFTEDRWVRTAECRPGTPGVVHHIVAYIVKGNARNPVGADGALSVLVGWAPGDLGLKLPPDTALRIPKGAKIRLEMHYTPNGTAMKDRSVVGVTFADKPPKYEMLMNEFANMGIAVPPNDPHYRAEATMRLPADARILSVVPHMHWRGKDYRYEVIHPDGKRETVLSVPRWDFGWQNVYRFQEPLKLPKGAKLHAVAHWDNSANNPINPAPKETVRFGLQSWEEMMVGWVSYVWERPETAAELAKNPPRLSDLMFDRFDANGDDVITPDEIPDRLKTQMLLLGIKLPDRMTREEFNKLFEGMRGRFGPRKPRDEEKKPDPPKKSEQVRFKDEAKGEKDAPAVMIGGRYEVEAKKNIAYYEGDGADEKKHKLDLFIPKGKKDFPVLFFIHGGAWTFGDRSWYPTLGENFAKNGVGTVIVSYRLTPQVQHPAHIEDVARAFAWTHANISKYGGRADQIFVTGQSAGGHLAALLATDEKYLKAHKLSPKNIKAVMPISGVYTIPPLLMENIFGKGKEVHEAASPMTHVSGKEPPFLILYADKDFPTIPEVSEKFCEALKDKKVEASIYKMKDRNHIDSITKLATNEADPAAQVLLQFVAKHSGMKLKPRNEKKDK